MILNELLNMNTVFPERTNWIKSSDDVYTVELEFPGFSKKDIEVTANSETLTVKAEKGERKKSHKISLNNLVSLEDIT
jgi:HSP20 family molecular chaperone IbpA